MIEIKLINQVLLSYKVLRGSSELLFILKIICNILKKLGLIDFWIVFEIYMLI